jgi:hypothetical protein
VISDAYVYFDSCVGNGFDTGSGTYSLTRDNCPPLFRDPPIGYWGGDAVVAETCSSANPGSGELIPPDELR